MQIMKSNEIKEIMSSKDVREFLAIARKELQLQEKILPLMTLAKKYNGIIAAIIAPSVLDKTRIEEILISLFIGLGVSAVFWIAEKLTEKTIYEIDTQIEELEKFWK